MPINSRQKGKAGENEAAKLWREFYPHCKRMFPRQQQGVKYPDIGCPDMNERWYVEVKRRGILPDSLICRYLDKATDDWVDLQCVEIHISEATPIVMFRENRGEWHIAYDKSQLELTCESDYSVSLSRYHGQVYIAPWSEFAEWLRNRTEVK